MKKNLKELQDREEELLEERKKQRVQLQKTDQEVEAITKEIAKLKEQEDYGSFKFVHANLPLIMSKVAPKHKVAPPREISLGTTSGSMVASIPWTEEKCSDENPCNTNVCPRCTLIHFQKVLGKLLAEYYTK